MIPSLLSPRGLIRVAFGVMFSLEHELMSTPPVRYARSGVGVLMTAASAASWLAYGDSAWATRAEAT